MANGKPTIVFFGTSSICLPFLNQLKNSFDISLIVTQPDATGRRNRKLIIPPVKTFAQSNNIRLIQPKNLRDPELVEIIRKTRPDITIVIAYGKILPKKIFSIPRFKTLNVHFSLLPLYRGAAPVQRALENGELITGITIFELDKKMDTGEIWSQMQYEILPKDTTTDIWEKLSSLGAPFLVKTINNIISGKIQKKPQDHDKATYAKPLTKAEGRINWNLTALQIYNKFRAYQPWPGIFFFMNQTGIRINNLNVFRQKGDYPSLQQKHPGDILDLVKSGLRICCANNTILEITEFQPQGKKNMTPHSFSLGHDIPEKVE